MSERLRECAARVRPRVAVQRAVPREAREEETALAQKRRRQEERAVQVVNRVLLQRVHERDRVAGDAAEVVEERALALCGLMAVYSSLCGKEFRLHLVARRGDELEDGWMLRKRDGTARLLVDGALRRCCTDPQLQAVRERPVLLPLHRVAERAADDRTVSHRLREAGLLTLLTLLPRKEAVVEAGEDVVDATARARVEACFVLVVSDVRQQGARYDECARGAVVDDGTQCVERESRRRRAHRSEAVLSHVNICELREGREPRRRSGMRRRAQPA